MSLHTYISAQMDVMNESEHRVLRAVADTLLAGWPRAVLSLTQFAERTGLSRQGVVDGVKAGLARKQGVVLRRERYGASYAYWFELVNLREAASQIDRPGGQVTSPPRLQHPPRHAPSIPVISASSVVNPVDQLAYAADPIRKEEGESPDSIDSESLPSLQDARLIALKADHLPEISETNLRRWAAAYGEERVLTAARWYAARRDKGEVYSPGWLATVLERALDFSGVDVAAYLTEAERVASWQAQGYEV